MLTLVLKLKSHYKLDLGAFLIPFQPPLTLQREQPLTISIAGSQFKAGLLEPSVSHDIGLGGWIVSPFVMK